MSARELDAAGITDPVLRESYETCRRLNASHGRTYYLATLLLPPAKRPYVHALYGFARYADEIVDDLGSTLTDEAKAARLEEFGALFLAGKDDESGVLPAIHDTVARWEIPLDYFEAFLHSMRMDLTVGGYRTFDDLMVYVYGSAAVIGLQMVHVVGTAPGADVAAALPYARDLGIGFQLANFLRDVGEDLRRDRVYLPQESLDMFGVTRADLATGVVDARVRRLLAYEVARAREYFRSSEPGIRLLDPTAQDCIRTAFQLYGGILDEVERADYRVLDRRVAVGPARRLSVAVPGLARAFATRRRSTRPS